MPHIEACSAGHLIADWPLVPRVLLIIAVMTPLMTYVLLPFATRRMQWFLQPGRTTGEGLSARA